MPTRLLAVSALLFSFLIPLAPSRAAADEHGRYSHDYRTHGGERWHDEDRWRGGHWYHGHHGGRLGWWWVVPGVGLGLWYLYSAPAYPYPQQYPPPVAAPPQADVPPPPAQYWYYCDEAQAYYPYVASCPGGWRKIPAIPPGAAAQP